MRNDWQSKLPVMREPEAPPVREIKWAEGLKTVKGVGEKSIDLGGAVFPSHGGALNGFVWERLAVMGERPAVYAWFRWGVAATFVSEILYVGQTLDLGRRTKEHLGRIERGSIGRIMLLERRKVRRDALVQIALAWKTYDCDCPLDGMEARLIALLKPTLNISPGKMREMECDDLCLNRQVP